MKKGTTRAVSLRRMVVEAVPSWSWPMNWPICVCEPRERSISPNSPAAVRAPVAIVIHRFQPMRPPTSPAVSAASAAAIAMAPPTSAPA